MIQNIADICFIFFFLLALLSPFVPIFLMWRLASLSGLFFTAATIIEGPLTDQNIAHFLGTIFVLVFSSIIALAVFTRFIFSAIRNTLSVVALIGPQNGFRLGFDTAAIVAVGCIGGLLLAISLSFGLSGAKIAINLDLTIATLAFAIAVVILAVSRKKLAITFTAVFAGLALSAFTVSNQANEILRTAETIANGRPWCLSASSEAGSISELQKLGFFALPKSGSYPHLGLLVRDKDQIVLAAHWSIRRQAFEKAGNTSQGVPTCHPINNYSETLKNGNIKLDTFGVGWDVYSIPHEWHPRVYIDRVSIRNNQLTGSNSTHPEITERMEKVYNPRETIVTDDVVPLEMMPDPRQLNPDNLTGLNRMVIAGLDEATNQKVFLHCLHGPYADHLCLAQIHGGSIGYSFYLPLHHLEKWREAAETVKALFASLKVE